MAAIASTVEFQDSAAASTGLHWVDELFPPTFNLNSSFDFNQSSSNGQDRRTIQKIYEDVYLSTVTVSSESQSESEGEVQLREATDDVASVEKKVGKDPRECVKKDVDQKAMKQATLNGQCMWTSEELGILRKSLERSRLNNIRLCVLTRSLRQDCERLRDSCQEQARKVLTCNEKYSNVKKQNIRMKIVCKAFKEDIKKYRRDLEENRELLQKAISDKENYEMELVQVNKELEYTRKKCKKLSLELENHKLLQNELTKNEKDAVEVMHAKELYKLTKKLKQTELDLEKEKNEHTINKTALANLRLHFASSTTQHFE